MPNNYRMSYFMPPIAPVRNEEGRIVTPATLLPFCEISAEQVFQMITCNEDLRLLTEQVRNTPDMRTAKATLLPYVTPCGTFTRRNGKCFLSPSRLIVIDVDHLDSYEEAARNAPHLVRRSLPPPHTYVYQPQRPGRESIRPDRHAISGRRDTECHRKHPQSHAICRNGLRPGNGHRRPDNCQRRGRFGKRPGKSLLPEPRPRSLIQKHLI